MDVEWPSGWGMATLWMGTARMCIETDELLVVLEMQDTTETGWGMATMDPWNEGSIELGGEPPWQSLKWGEQKYLIDVHWGSGYVGCTQWVGEWPNWSSKWGFP